MNRTFKGYALIWGVLFAAFQVICFVIPNKVAGFRQFATGSWMGYIFITLAFVGQFVCAYIAFDTENRTKLFYKIPMIRISYIGLILTVIFGVLCMAIPDFPSWLAFAGCGLILAVTAAAAIGAKTASDLVESVDEKISNQTLFVKSMTGSADSLLSRAETSDAKAVCKKVYEAIRYSDPMSNDGLADLENQIVQKFSEFSSAVTDGTGDIHDLANELLVLIDDRNKLCKSLK